MADVHTSAPTQMVPTVVGVLKGGNLDWMVSPAKVDLHDLKLGNIEHELMK